MPFLNQVPELGRARRQATTRETAEGSPLRLPTAATISGSRRLVKRAQKATGAARRFAATNFGVSGTHRVGIRQMRSLRLPAVDAHNKQEEADVDTKHCGKRLNGSRQRKRSFIVKARPRVGSAHIVAGTHATKPRKEDRRAEATGNSFALRPVAALRAPSQRWRDRKWPTYVNRHCRSMDRAPRLAENGPPRTKVD